MSYDCSCDYDAPELYTASIVRARKTYSCCECGAKIEPGEQYEYVFGKWEGSVSTFKTCQGCRDIRQWVKNNVPCLCWSHGSAIEDCREAVQEAVYRAPDVCADWRNDFAKFFSDVGPRPSPKHSIDRIDNSKNYEPGNVKWSVPKEQSNNRRPRRWFKKDAPNAS